MILPGNSKFPIQKELDELRKDKRVPYLIESTCAFSAYIPIKDVIFSIGSSRSCDMRLNGWFKPKIAAKIYKRTNGFFIARSKRSSIEVNGKKIRREVKLHDDDDLLIHRKRFKFYYRPLS